MDKENQAVNTKPEAQATRVEDETTGNPEVKTRRKLKLQLPITLVDAPKKVKQKETMEEIPVPEEKNEPAHESKLKKVARGVAVVGLAIGTGLVALGSYLKGKEQGMDAAMSWNEVTDDPDGTMEPEPDPAGVNTENPNDD